MYGTGNFSRARDAVRSRRACIVMKNLEAITNPRAKIASCPSLRSLIR